MKTILITGGNGLIGKRLSRLFIDKGYCVRILSRNKTTKKNSFYWNTDSDTIQNGALDDVDCIIHLAGADISAKRWTNKRRQEIIDSRIKTGELLFKQLSEKNIKPTTFISASAIGYYGSQTTDTIFEETHNAGSDFISSVCKQWEQMADQFESCCKRIVKIRVGVVLSSQSGALPKMMQPIKLGMGAALGSGKQYLPWIHIDDVCNIFAEAVENQKYRNVYNAVAPSDETNTTFTQKLAINLNKKIILPNVPTFVLYAIFGKMADIILKGSRVSSSKIIEAGFSFQYPDLNTALNDVLKRNI